MSTENYPGSSVGRQAGEEDGIGWVLNSNKSGWQEPVSDLMPSLLGAAGSTHSTGKGGESLEEKRSGRALERRGCVAHRWAAVG